MNNINWNKVVSKLKKADRVLMWVVNDRKTEYESEFYMSDGDFMFGFQLVRIPDKIKEFVAMRFNKFPEDGDGLMSWKDGSIVEADNDPRRIFEIEGDQDVLLDTGLRLEMDKDLGKVFYNFPKDEYVVFSMANMGDFFKDWSQVNVRGGGSVQVAKFTPTSGQWGMVGMPMRPPKEPNQYLAKGVNLS